MQYVLPTHTNKKQKKKVKKIKKKKYEIISV